MDDAWTWQGFFGPAVAVAAAKQAADAADPATLGVVVPERGEPPMPMDPAGVMAIFAVQARPDAPWPTPPGLTAVRGEIAGRLVGA